MDFRKGDKLIFVEPPSNWGGAARRKWIGVTGTLSDMNLGGVRPHLVVRLIGRYYPDGQEIDIRTTSFSPSKWKLYCDMCGSTTCLALREDRKET